MKYRSVIAFDPIKSVIELLDAGELDKAEHLVHTYVISDEMANRLTEIVIPQLRFDQPADNHGLFVVGDYGTGKSHLMSVIAAVAEYEEIVSQVRNEEVATAASRIAGKFKVHRIEIGSTKMDLRDIIVGKLESCLSALGVAYTFPEADEIPSHKPAFEDMMTAFHEQYPDQGLLLVVDELLDYLAGRKQLDIINDLGFLREVGEVCNSLRFRFIAGVQESLFESPSFQFAADRLRRVKDRFEQVRIARSDIKYVVQERLLKKTAEQQAKIRAHLTRFAPFYGKMTERMDEFVRLFPVHPDYIDTFGSLTLIEKREILKTLSQEMNDRIDDSVPTDEPGLIAYDSYWPRIEANKAFHSIPAIRDVLECVNVLETRVRQAMPEAYRRLAVRLIHGLAIQRLAVSDVYAPIGVTAADLRDGLCLYDPMIAEMGGPDPADDLEGHIQVVLQKITKIVNGQFITHNENNGQYYIDLEKTEDYDAIIANKADTLSEDHLDNYYFTALRHAMELSDDPYVTGHKIWEYQLPWHARNVERRGYLLFGAPNERSTAAPPRDFYVYFLQPFDPPSFDDNRPDDEVFFKLTETDDAFRERLHTYAAAMELWGSASGSAKRVYLNKAHEARDDLAAWIRNHLRTAFAVTHAGETKTLAERAEGLNIRERLGLGPDETANVRDVVDTVAASCLDGHFETTAREYPSFDVRVTTRNLSQSVRQALLQLDDTRTRQGAAVLEGLELVQDGNIRPRQSRYARHVLGVLDAKKGDSVANRDELLTETPKGMFMEPDRFRLEPEWVVVVLAALVANGDLVLALPGRKFDATDLRALVHMDVEALTRFRYVEPPKDWPVAAIRALLELLGMPPGNAQAMAAGDDGPIGKLQDTINQAIRQAVEMEQALGDGLVIWETNLLTSSERDAYREHIQGAKRFLESVQSYDTLGKMKNFHPSVEEVERHREGMEALRHVQAVYELQTTLSTPATYLSKAETVLPEDHDLAQTLREKRAAFRSDVTDPDTRARAAFRTQMRNELQELKSQYVTAYIQQHTRDRLGQADDRRKGQLAKDRRLMLLDELARINILPAGQLEALKDRVGALKSCFDLTEDDLQARPICPECGYEPPASRTAPASAQLRVLEDDLAELVQEWTSTLAQELDDPGVRENVALLDAKQQSLIENFLDDRALESPLPDGFVDAVNTVLEGLTPVHMTREEVYEALRDGGAPATAEDIRTRFETLLASKIDGRDADSIRFVLQ